MEEYFVVPFKLVPTYNLYKRYESGDESVLESLLISTCPLIRMVRRKEVGSSVENDASEIETDALDRVYLLYREKDLPSGPTAFRSYLYRTIYRTMLGTIKRLEIQNFDFEYVCRTPEFGRVKNHYEVERSIYDDQVSNLTRIRAKHSIRFGGVEKELCNQLIDSLLQYSNVDINYIKVKFHACRKQISFLEKYCEILIKSIRYDLINES